MFRRSFHFLKALLFLLGIFASANLSASNGEVTTGSLVLEDLKNTSEWNAETTGFSGNFSKQVNAKEGDPVIPSQASASPTLGQEEGDSDNGMTRSAISAGEITLKNGGDLSGIHRDTANANAGSLSMDAIPNLSETFARQADRSAVAAQASAVVAQTVGDVSDAMSNGSLVENGFEEGGLYRAGLHGLSQGIVAGLGGGNAVAAGAGAAASSYFAPTFHTGNEETDKLLGNLVSGGLGFAIGGNSGAFASSSVDANNRQLHPIEKAIITLSAEKYAELYNAEHPDSPITAEQAKKILTDAAWYGADPNIKELRDLLELNDNPALKKQYEDALAFLKAQGPAQIDVLANSADFSWAFGEGDSLLPAHDGSVKTMELFTPDGSEIRTIFAGSSNGVNGSKAEIYRSILNSYDPVLGLAALHYGGLTTDSSQQYQQGSSYLNYVRKQSNEYNGTSISKGALEQSATEWAALIKAANNQDRPISTFVRDNDDQIAVALFGGGLGLARSGMVGGTVESVMALAADVKSAGVVGAYYLNAPALNVAGLTIADLVANMYAPGYNGFQPPAIGSTVDEIFEASKNLFVFETGVNITPRSIANLFRVIGRNGRTFVTEPSAVERIIGPLQGNRIIISSQQATELENPLGLIPGSLESKNILYIIDNIPARSPASPISGNNFFAGGGVGLPGGGKELTIQGIPSAGSESIRQIIIEVKKQ